MLKALLQRFFIKNCDMPKMVFMLPFAMWYTDLFKSVCFSECKGEF